jgi:hypothetical protein
MQGPETTFDCINATPAIYVDIAIPSVFYKASVC